MSIVLVDMDGVLADIEQGLFNALMLEYNMPAIHPTNRRGFWMDKHYRLEFPEQADEYCRIIDEILYSERFFATLPSMPGAVKGITKLRDVGHTVKICTAPLARHLWQPSEKYEWVRQVLGESWLNDIILCKDKTMINGDYLIDDKAEITGAFYPQWTHVLYDGHTNTDVRDNWHEGFRFTWKQHDHWLYRG